MIRGLDQTPDFPWALGPRPSSDWRPEAADGKVRSALGANDRMKGILSKAGWAPKNPALSAACSRDVFSCEPIPSWPPSLLPAAIHLALPRSFWYPLRAGSLGLALGGSRRMPAAGERRAESALGNKDTSGSVCTRTRSALPPGPCSCSAPCQEHSLVFSASLLLQIPPSLPGGSVIPTARGSRGEPLLPDLPDPTPEPRENGSCHTSRLHTYWEASRRR